MTRPALCLLLVSLGAIVLGPAGCAPPGLQPIDATAVVFWDRQFAETATLLDTIVSEFNQQHPGLPVRVEKSGNYGDIYKKVSAGIEAGKLPALATSYASMTTDYASRGAAVPLDPFINDPTLGLNNADLADFYPAMLDANRYPQLGGQYYSFPMAKSVLLLYFNKLVLEEAELLTPPKTWDEFLEQARQIKDKTGKHALGLDMDASTFSGIVFSQGGGVYAAGETLFDRPASIAALELIATLGREKLAFQVQPGTFQDQDALARNETAFSLRTSAGRYYVGQQMGGKLDTWGLSMIPQADRLQPATVLFGPDITLLAVGKEQEERAWQFVRYFTQPDTQTRWALGSGYLPVRASVLEDPAMQGHFAAWLYNRVPFDALAHARAEPNVGGWQEVRSLVERAMTEVFTGTTTPEEAARHLKQQADAVIGSG